MALKVVEGGQHALVQADGSSDDLNSAFNIIKTTNTSNEIIYAKEYNYSNHKVGNSYAVHSMGSELSNGKMQMVMLFSTQVVMCWKISICLVI